MESALTRRKKLRIYRNLKSYKYAKYSLQHCNNIVPLGTTNKLIQNESSFKLNRILLRIMFYVGCVFFFRFFILVIIECEKYLLYMLI